MVMIRYLVEYTIRHRNGEIKGMNLLTDGETMMEALVNAEEEFEYMKKRNPDISKITIWCIRLVDEEV